MRQEETESPSQQDIEWLHSHCRAIGMIEKSSSGKLAHDIALFTTQLQEKNKQLQTPKKPLTDNEITLIAKYAYGFASKDAEFRTRFVRAVERAHGIVNDRQA